MTFSFKKRKVIIIIIFLIFMLSMAKAQDNDFSKEWYIASSENINLSGEHITSDIYSVNNKFWYKTDLPSTVLSSLIKNGVYKNIYFNRNLEEIDKNIFLSPWWYRKEFKIVKSGDKFYKIIFNGINYKADIFLNGHKIARKEKIYGAFNRFKLDITPFVKNGKNIIALKIYPPKKGDYSIGFVDWNPKPPDSNMGIWRTVELKETGAVTLKNIFAKPSLDLEKGTAEVLIIGSIVNNTSQKIKTKISVYVKEADLGVLKEIELSPKEERNSVIARLFFKSPKLWWPNNLGEPYLYHAEIDTYIGGKLSDKTEIRFGIRKVEDYYTKDGFRGFKINGKKILIKGGGWVDDLTLTYDKKYVEAQIKYIKDMNLNTIRLEGFWGNSQYLYDLADENGLLILVGFSCHWEWEDYLGVPVDEKFNGPKDEMGMKLLTDYLKNQIIWLRNHPSIFCWAVGSDKIPHPELEKKYVEIIDKYDGTRPYIAAAKEFTSKVSGPTGIKMRGPYAFTVPSYWYEDKENGGALGFNSETGPGAQIPVLESLKKMIPGDRLWPINDEWDYHCARNEFKNISRFVKGLKERYGKPKNLKEFVSKAQMLNYELIRPMFEAFSVNRYKATGIIQWMLNSAWPAMYWQLYDWYLVPTAAYYGTKEAAKPLHIIYRYYYDDVYVVNERFRKEDNLIAKVKVFNQDSKLIFAKMIPFSINENNSLSLNTGLKDYIKKSKGSFVSLKLYKDGKEVDSNFYWLSKNMDVLDFKKTDWFITPVKKYADFRWINKIPVAKIKVQLNSSSDNSRKIIIKNLADKIAFFIEVKVFNKNDDIAIPVTLSDNYISLLPGERKSISFIAPKGYKVILKGWNTNKKIINIDDKKELR